MARQRHVRQVSIPAKAIQQRKHTVKADALGFMHRDGITVIEIAVMAGVEGHGVLTHPSGDLGALYLFNRTKITVTNAEVAVIFQKDQAIPGGQEHRSLGVVNGMPARINQPLAHHDLAGQGIEVSHLLAGMG